MYLHFVLKIFCDFFCYVICTPPGLEVEADLHTITSAGLHPGGGVTTPLQEDDKGCNKSNVYILIDVVHVCSGLGLEVPPPIETDAGLEVPPPIETDAGLEVPPPIETDADLEVPPPIETDAGLEVPPPIETDAGLEVPPPDAGLEVLPPIETDAGHGECV